MLQALLTSKLYLSGQTALGATRARRLCIRDYMEVKPRDRVLDIGCGPGYVLDYLPQVDYVGFDINRRYIDYAIWRFGRRARFYCQEFTAEWIPEVGKFDWVILLGLLHHLDDAQALNCLNISSRVLKPSGHLISMDGVFCEKQSPLARFLLRYDRGKFVRMEPDYLFLASQVFPSVTSHLRQDMLYVPYNMIMMDCRI